MTVDSLNHNSKFIIQTMSSLPSGVRLVRLLNEHLNDIMSCERTNTASIHLYCTGPYWVAFEYSAYQLRRAFPDSEVTPMRLFGYPFPVVMVSVTDRSLRSYARKHILRRDDKDYKQLTVPRLSLMDYQRVARRRGGGVTFIELESMSGKVAQTSYYRYF